MKRNCLPLLLAIFLSLLSAAVTVCAMAREPYAVIEVGASGIKGLVMEVVTEDPDGPPTRTLKEYEPLDKNAFTLDASVSGRISEGVARMLKQMRDDFKIAARHFYVVGSSGLPPEVRAALSNTIFDEGVKINYVTPAQEADLLFRAIVPVRRLNQVVVIDIGSGNVKGAYVEKTRPKLELTEFALPWGTKTWAQEINKGRGDGDFMVTAEAFRREKLLPAVREEIQQKPGLQNLRRVYVVGGIPWSLTTLLHPYNQEDWVALSLSDILTFYKKATTDPGNLLDPDLNHAPSTLSQSELENVKQEVTRVGKVFNEDQLMAGAQLFKTLMEELRFERKEAIFFYRKALYAWPRGYVLERISEGGGTP